MNRVFQNAHVSSPLQESLKKGETVMYIFSNPGRISERVASLKEKIGGLKWPKWDKEGFQKELEPFISSLTELEQDCHSYHESFLQSAVECTGIINTRKGSIKKSLRILHNNLSVSFECSAFSRCGLSLPERPSLPASSWLCRCMNR